MRCAFPADQGLLALIQPLFGHAQDGRAAHGLLEAPASEAETGKMDTLTYWNGTWHEGNPAILGPGDHAFWLGSIVFDGGRAFEGCGPDLDLHAERVVRSARSPGPNPARPRQEILELMHEAIRRF